MVEQVAPPPPHMSSHLSGDWSSDSNVEITRSWNEMALQQPSNDSKLNTNHLCVLSLI